jgi:hypothetical protein
VKQITNGILKQRMDSQQNIYVIIKVQKVIPQDVRNDAANKKFNPLIILKILDNLLNGIIIFSIPNIPQQ